jgi:hypothetical protein
MKRQPAEKAGKFGKNGIGECNLKRQFAFDAGAHV